MFVTVCGKTPRDLGAAFVAGTAVVAGDVTLEAGSTVWYGAVLRGDEGSILVVKDSYANSFVPYLTVKYEITKEGGKTIKGTFMPMSASDGPHYGNTVKLDGPGKYKVTFIIDNPEKQGYLLHVDKATGVVGRFWKKPIEVSWDFNYVPRVW